MPLQEQDRPVHRNFALASVIRCDRVSVACGTTLKQRGFLNSTRKCDEQDGENTGQGADGFCEHSFSKYQVPSANLAGNLFSAE